MSRDLPPYGFLVRWTVSDVLEWLKKVNLYDLKDTFREKNIDGAKLAKLTDSEIDGYKAVNKRKREDLKRFIDSIDRSKPNSIPKTNMIRPIPSNVPSSRPPATLPSREPAPLPRHQSPRRPSPRRQSPRRPSPPTSISQPPPPDDYMDEVDPYDIGWSEDEFSDGSEDYENVQGENEMGVDGGYMSMTVSEAHRNTSAGSLVESLSCALTEFRRMSIKQKSSPVTRDSHESDEDYENCPTEEGPEPPPIVPRRPIMSHLDPPPRGRSQPAPVSTAQVPSTPARPPPHRSGGPSHESHGSHGASDEDHSDGDDYVEPISPQEKSPAPAPPLPRRPHAHPELEPAPPPPRTPVPRVPPSRPSVPQTAQPPVPARRARPPTPPADPPEDVYEQPDPEPQPPPPPPSRNNHGVSQKNRRLPPPPVVEERDELSGQEWYQSSVQRQEAEEVMKRLRQDGMYVVRKSQKVPSQPYTLMIHKDGRVYNLPVRRRTDNKYALGKEKQNEPSFPSVPHMIDYFKHRALVLNPTIGDSGQTALMHPLPRL